MEDKGIIEKRTYDNWRIVTNADFVTLFIKTWFSFVATLRELYKDYTKPYYEATGDKPYLSQYEKEFSENYYFMLKYSSIEGEMIRTYKHGFKMICEKYPRFLIDDFHSINKSFKEHYAETFSAPGGYSGILRLTIRSTKDNILKVELICTDKLFLSKTENHYAIVKTEIDVKTILDGIIVDVENNDRYIAETGLLVIFHKLFYQLIASKLVDKLEEKKNALVEKGKKQIKQVYSLMQSFCLRACEEIKTQCLNPKISDEHKLLFQIPTFEFTQSIGSLSSLEEQRTYLWFVNFSYRLRNALFHEIIDPLDASWQLIFQNAYLVLKHIVEANVARLKMCALLEENAKHEFESDFRNAPPPDIPIASYVDTSFLFDQVKLKYYNNTGAKVFVSSTIICNGYYYKVECNVTWNEGLKQSKVKNVQITKLDQLSESEKESEGK